MTLRLLLLIALATATSACLGLRMPPRFGNLRAESRPFEFHHGIRLYTLSNGMRVVLVPDSRTNLVTVDARYRVGAAEDPPGRAGLAHLVEHLTFEARVGFDQANLGNRLGEATLGYNAYTTHDYTHYTATALSPQLSDVLELEAQRLELTCAQLDDDVFSRERDVVLEEEAQRRTSWGDLQREISRAVWGQHHPYARGIATREVADTSRDEACRFLGGHYAPDRLILTVTGDFDPDKLVQVIGRRFGRIQRKSDAPRASVQQVRLTGTRTYHDADVDEAVALVYFPAPPWGSEEGVLHELSRRRLSQTIAQLDMEHAWITDTHVTSVGAGQAQSILVMLTVDESRRLEAAVDEVFARAPSMFADVGPYQASNLLGRMQTGYVASFESFATRGDWLTDYLTYTQHTGFMLPALETLERTTMVDADRYAQARFVREASHVALVKPSGRPATVTPAPVASGREPDLPLWHVPVDPSEAERPLPPPTLRTSVPIDELTLDNGLRVLLAPDPSSALVDARLVFPHGSSSDPLERRGRAQAAASLLEPDPNRRYQASDVLLLGWGRSVGTQHGVEVHETSTVFTARGTSNLADWHVWRLWWLIDQCGYQGSSVDTFRDELIRANTTEEDPARALTLQLLFGAGHPYATPRPTGDAWRWLNASELERHRAAYYVARGATLIITGGFEVEAMRAHVRELFAPWPAGPAQPAVTLPMARPEPGPGWIGTREPSRTQVGLRVAFSTASEPDGDLAARLVLEEMVSDRLRFVRDGMGASYGVGVAYATRVGGGALFIESELDPERGTKAATAILSELEALRTGAGAMAEDFVRARRRVLARTLAEAADVIATADELEYVVRRGLAVDSIDQLALAISRVTPAEVATVATVDLDPRRRVVSVAATPERLDGVMRALGATEPRIFDKEHRPGEKKKP